MAGTDAKGAPTFANTDAADFADDLTEGVKWASDRMGETVASASNLPASGSWVGRELTTVDTEALYKRFSAGWKMIARAATAWTGVTFVSGWANAGGAFVTTQYRFNSSNNVELRGQITPRTGYANGETMFTLPAGSRPSGTMSFPGVNNGGASPALAQVLVQADGQVKLYPAGIAGVNLGLITIPVV